MFYYLGQSDKVKIHNTVEHPYELLINTCLKKAVDIVQEMEQLVKEVQDLKRFQQAVD